MRKKQLWPSETDETYHFAAIFINRLNLAKFISVREVSPKGSRGNMSPERKRDCTSAKSSTVA